MLVDVQGNRRSTSVESVSIQLSDLTNDVCALLQALSTISYIGCGISIFSLLLTMFAIVYWRYV